MSQGRRCRPRARTPLFVDGSEQLLEPHARARRWPKPAAALVRSTGYRIEHGSGLIGVSRSVPERTFAGVEGRERGCRVVAHIHEGRDGPARETVIAETIKSNVTLAGESSVAGTSSQVVSSASSRRSTASSWDSGRVASAAVRRERGADHAVAGVRPLERGAASPLSNQLRIARLFLACRPFGSPNNLTTTSTTFLWPRCRSGGWCRRCSRGGGRLGADRRSSSRTGAQRIAARRRRWRGSLRRAGART